MKKDKVNMKLNNQYLDDIMKAFPEEKNKYDLMRRLKKAEEAYKAKAKR